MSASKLIRVLRCPLPGSGMDQASLFSLEIEPGNFADEDNEPLNVTWKLFRDDGDNGQPEIYAHGSMGWDGCAHHAFEEGDYHFCDKEQVLEFGAVLAWIYDVGADIMKVHFDR